MSDAPAPVPPPLVLLANAQEWVARSLESLLRPAGYAVLRAYNARDALAGARRARPDAIVLDTALPEANAFDLCRALRVDPAVAASTAIVMTTPSPAIRRQVIAALRAGANDLWGQPLDAEECLLRLASLLRAKLDADRAREQSLVDERTGLYNAHGLERRVRELAAQAERVGAPLACVVLAPATPAPSPASAGAGAGNGPDPLVESLGRLLKAVGRMSDTIGQLGPREFAVLAPHTDAAGALGLGERLARAAEGGTHEAGAPPLQLRAGYEAVTAFRSAAVDPSELLSRATRALRAAERDGTEESWIQRFAP